MIEVRLADPAGLGKLMEAAAYESHVSTPHGPSGH
jgi:hypothetical protein